MKQGSIIKDIIFFLREKVSFFDKIVVNLFFIFHLSKLPGTFILIFGRLYYTLYHQPELALIKNEVNGLLKTYKSVLPRMQATRGQ